MALRRGWGQQGTINQSNLLASGPKTFWLPGGTETTVVLLDDQPVECVRHVQYLKGDKKGNGMRLTCAGLDPTQHPEQVPQLCVVCNAMLRADRIARKHFLYLTLIDERQFDHNGTTYKDMKRLLELTPDAAELFIRRRQAAGTLIGARFKVYRSKSQRATRHGDDWTFLGFVWNQQQGEPPQQGLMRHFWKSPAIPNIRKNAQQRNNQPMDWQAAAQDLITPYPYEDLMGTYDQQKAIAFVAYHAQATGLTGLVGAAGTDMSGAAMNTAPSGGAQADSSGAPPFPGGGQAPDYSTQAPATMPTGQAPSMPAGGAPDYTTAPAAQGQAPSLPDPTAAGGPGMGQAPAFPGSASAPAFPGASAQPPANAPPTYDPNPSAAGIPGAGYDFGGGQAPATAQPPAPAQNPATAQPSAPAFPGAQGMTGGPGEPTPAQASTPPAPQEPFGI